MARMYSPNGGGYNGGGGNGRHGGGGAGAGAGGGFRRTQQGSGFQAGGGGGGAQISIGDAIKGGQRASGEFKDAWHAYCEHNGSNTFDPSKHGSEFCSNFFAQLGELYKKYGTEFPATEDPQAQGGRNTNRGSAMAPQRDAQKLQDLIDLIKTGELRDDSWRDMWQEWCAEKGGGVSDVSKYVQKPMFMVAFVFKWGLAAVCESEWAKPFLVSLGDVSKPFMVQTVKKGQSQDPEWRDAWGAFADEKMNYRDPNLHDPGSLLEFFDTVALLEFGNKPYMEPFLKGTDV